MLKCLKNIYEAFFLCSDLLSISQPCFVVYIINSCLLFNSYLRWITALEFVIFQSINNKKKSLRALMILKTSVSMSYDRHLFPSGAYYQLTAITLLCTMEFIFVYYGILSHCLKYNNLTTGKPVLCCHRRRRENYRLRCNTSTIRKCLWQLNVEYFISCVANFTSMLKQLS